MLQRCHKSYIVLMLHPCYKGATCIMGRQGNVRVDANLIEKAKQLVKIKKDALGLKKYRSVSQVAEDALRDFLVKESKPVEVPV